MIFRTLKYGTIGLAGACLLGAVVFGKDLASYMRCSARSVQSALKDSVPLEFELERAREMVEQIIPEMNAQIRLIAQDEVEIEVLKADIRRTNDRLEKEKKQIALLRDKLGSEQVSLVVNGRERGRDQIARQLKRRFDFYVEATDILASKEKLLQTREDSLHAARQALERARERKIQLGQQIESLVAKHRQLKASAVGTRVQIDSSQLARAEKLISQITKRLAIAERVMEHESDYVDPLYDDAVNEGILLEEIDDYFDLDRDTESTEDAHGSEA